ncbi:glycosyltransferase family 4 protein [Brevundimonas subvibrioides]|uniref:Glycosyl transferase group 1 n=1 Tax=Brevundimonas subvibrioides (strain ATCC 15264 / DSM 4735 / LMG 14903 / NBRC 16000 / CB 81) TaxID=633149 RepID=D9QP33_BRESC|nr:glycosyltransferase family 4 protein [Brevundimonas subvibrioides]ADL00466.1 glycosyl transferase group 1 [Brevundimonas subvibrioides ATCC 15264]
MKREGIAILDPLGSHGGFHYYTDGLAEGVAHAGRRVVLYGYDLAPKPTAKYLRQSAFKDLYGPASKWLRALRYLGFLTRALVDARARRLEIVHMHSFHYDARELIAACLSRLLGFKLVVTLHDIDSFGSSSGKAGRSAITALADGLVVHNEFSRVALNPAGAPPGRAPVAVIPHGHYADRWGDSVSRAAARTSLGLPGDRTVALFFGNPRSEKGLDILLEALRLVQNKNLLVLVAGRIEENDLAGLRALEAGELAGRLRIDAGWIDDNAIADYYAAADIVVLPYLRIYESGVAIMAMTFGRCVVYSDLPPLLETVGTEGVSFRTKDPVDLAVTLDRLVQTHVNLDELGQRARRKVLSDRSWLKIGADTVRLYDAATARREH